MDDGWGARVQVVKAQSHILQYRVADLEYCIYRYRYIIRLVEHRYTSLSCYTNTGIVHQRSILTCASNYSQTI